MINFVRKSRLWSYLFVISFVKFCSLVTLLRLNLLILSQYRGNNACITDAILTKLNVHQRIEVIYILIKFHQIPLIGYLVMAPDGRDKQKDEWMDMEKNYIPPPSAGDKKIKGERRGTDGGT